MGGGANDKGRAKVPDFHCRPENKTSFALRVVSRPGVTTRRDKRTAIKGGQFAELGRRGVGGHRPENERSEEKGKIRTIVQRQRDRTKEWKKRGTTKKVKGHLVILVVERNGEVS